MKAPVNGRANYLAEVMRYDPVMESPMEAKRDFLVKE